MDFNCGFSLQWYRDVVQLKSWSSTCGP